MSYLLLPVALLAARITAQTFAICNPLNTTGCPNDPALGTTYETVFNSSNTQLDTTFWNITAGTSLMQFNETGAQLNILKHGDSVTARSSFYIFWGQVEIIMQAASGTGIISTFNLLSDDLDEIDVEIMGGNHSFVETNYYGWGNLSQHNALYHPCDGPQEKMHNYTLIWDQQEIQWFIDGNMVRSQAYEGPGQYPQTPSYLNFGIWAGGDSSEPNGTIKWAGGETDYSKGPFTMIVKSIKITDGSTNTSSYLYGDKSGSYQSIKALPGQSKAYQAINKKTAAQKALSSWNGLSTGAKIGIACGVIGFCLICVGCWTAFCIVQRKKGRAERAIADKQWETQHAELMEYRNRMARGDFAVTHMGHGEKF